MVFALYAGLLVVSTLFAVLLSTEISNRSDFNDSIEQARLARCIQDNQFAENFNEASREQHNKIITAFVEGLETLRRPNADAARVAEEDRLLRVYEEGVRRGMGDPPVWDLRDCSEAGIQASLTTSTLGE